MPDDIALTSRTSNANMAIEMARAERLIARQLDQHMAGKSDIPEIISMPEEVVADMRAWFDGDACDGFNVCPTLLPGNMHDFVEITVPELLARGLFRAEYKGSALRENLGLPPVRRA